MDQAVSIRWNVPPADLAEVRRASLYPFKSASRQLDDEMTANPDTIFAGAFRKNKPIGCIAVLPETGYDCEWRIRWFGVLTAERGQGIGTKLVRVVQQEAVNNCVSIWAEVRIKAIPVYERLGFEALGDFFDLPKIGVHRVMRWSSARLRS
tara:strand:+ start:398 stop:850 length:453 start_codon:yes stop_codon:yes gene_type:complete